VALSNEVDWNEEGVLPEDFHFVFTEGAKSFFKNTETQEMDETIGDLDAVSDCNHKFYKVFTIIPPLIALSLVRINSTSRTQRRSFLLV